MTINSSVNERSESGFVISVIARSEATKQSHIEIATGSPGESPRNDRDTTFLKVEIATPHFGRLEMTKG